jgi:hypothetical protein
MRQTLWQSASAQLAATRLRSNRSEADGVGINRGLRVGIVVIRYAAVMIGGLQDEQAMPPVERDGRG